VRYIVSHKVLEGQVQGVSIDIGK